MCSDYGAGKIMIFKKILYYILLTILVILIVSGLTDRLYLGNKATIQELLLNDWLPLLAAFLLGFMMRKCEKKF
jgi:cytochrome b subunit of formate dehydrogenase